ncbi:unnamed protein product [Victoria cruziana]
MNRRKGSERGRMKGRKRRRIDCSDDSDEDFVVDGYDDDDDDDMDCAVDEEDDGHGRLSGSDDPDAEARRKKPRRNLSRHGVGGRKRKGGISNGKVDEDDEEFDPGMEYVTEDDESVVSEKALVKKQATKRRTGKVAGATHRKSVLRSRVGNKRKRHVRRRRKKPEDGPAAGGERLGRKRTRLKSRTKRARKLEPRPDSDSDFIVSDAVIGAPAGVSIDRSLEICLRSSWWLRRRRAACKSEYRLQKRRRSKRAGKLDEIEYNGNARTSNLCKEVCGICLSEERRGTIRGRLDSCDHFFCFACIMEWSKVESRCPMCKQRFVSINKSSKCGFFLGGVSIRVPRRNQVYQPSEEELRSYLDPYANIVCTVCHGGGDDNLMLLCDICDSSAHTYCVGLGREVPEGNWYCEGCRSFDLGVSNLQRDQDPGMDQLVDISLCSEGFIGSGDTPIPSNSLSECFKTSPSPYSCQRGNLSPQSPFRGDPVITSQVSGFGASTVMSRRTLRHQIHILMTNNRMSQTLDLADIENVPTNATFGSDALKSEAEQVDEGKECFGGLEHEAVCDLVVNSGDRCGTLEDTFGESSSRQLQHRELFSGENLSLDDSDTRNADGSNFSHNRAEVVHSVVYSEGTRGVEKDKTKDESNSQLHDVKHQVCSLVKHHIKSFARDAHLRRCEFKYIARRSTHTIVAAYGYKCSSNMAILVEPPNCCHARDDFGLRNLAKHCCFSCFNTFVGGVVQKIMKNDLKL